MNSHHALIAEIKACHQRIDELEKAGQWRAIETVPKDKTPFWGKEGDDAIAMFWHPKFCEFVSSFHRMTMAPGYTMDGESEHDHSPVVHRPDFWMPLPAPPQTQVGDNLTGASASEPGNCPPFRPAVR